MNTHDFILFKLWSGGKVSEEKVRLVSCSQKAQKSLSHFTLQRWCCWWGCEWAWRKIQWIPSPGNQHLLLLQSWQIPSYPVWYTGEQGVWSPTKSSKILTVICDKPQQTPSKVAPVIHPKDPYQLEKRRCLNRHQREGCSD